MTQNNSFVLLPVLLVSVMLLSGCYSTKIIVSKDDTKINPSNLTYSNYWSAMLMADPSYIDSNIVDEQQVELARIIEKIVNNDFQRTVPGLWKIFNECPVNDTTNMKYFAFQYLYGFYRQIGRLDTCLLLQYLYNPETNIEDSVLAVVHNNYINDHPESISMLKDVDTLPMIEISSGHPIVEVEIDGRKYKFVFDTGAMITIVDGELAKECGINSLTGKETTMGTSNELNLQTKEGYCNELKFGSTSIKNHLTYISEEEDMDFKFLWIFTVMECDGLIGWPIIKNFDITFDFLNKQIIIRKPVKKDSIEKNMFWLMHPIIKLKTKDGIPLNAYFDSGANSTNFTEIIKQKIPKANLGWNLDFSSGLGGSVFHLLDTYPEIDLFTNNKKINLKDIDINVNSGLIIKYDAILGSDLGKNGKIRIDATNGIFEVESTSDRK